MGESDKQQGLDCHCEPGDRFGKITKAAGAAAVVGATGVMLAPAVFTSVNIGKGAFNFVSDGVLCGGAFPSGLAGFVSHNLEYVPVIGDSLAKGEVAGALFAAGVIVGGKFAGNYFAANQNQPKLGRVVKGASTVVGITCMLPAILPPLKEGAKFLAAVSGNYDWVMPINNTIGYTGQPMAMYADAQVAGVLGSVLAAHVGCIVTGVSVMLATFFDPKCKNNPAKKEAAEVRTEAWSATGGSGARSFASFGERVKAESCDRGVEF